MNPGKSVQRVLLCFDLINVNRNTVNNVLNEMLNLKIMRFLNLEDSKEVSKVRTGPFLFYVRRIFSIVIFCYAHLNFLIVTG